jgi:hypothetical protein
VPEDPDQMTFLSRETGFLLDSDTNIALHGPAPKYNLDVYLDASAAASKYLPTDRSAPDQPGQ